VLAHKVILSACSPYFRSILARHPHQHPLLFLRGVRQQDLANILDFMYHGEVNVAQEELNTFLAIAEELQVKGLTQEDKRTGQGEPAKAGAGQRSVEGRTGVGPPAKRRRHDEEVAEISTNPGSAPVKTELEPTESVIYPAALESGEHVEDIYQEQEEQYQEYSGYDEDAYEVQAVGGGARPESNKEMIHFVMSQLEEKFDSAGKKFYQCKHCEFGFIKKEKVRQHIETVHGDGMGIRYNCDYCEKNYKSHSNLRTHVSSNHRQNLISTWS